MLLFDIVNLTEILSRLSRQAVLVLGAARIVLCTVPLICLLSATLAAAQEAEVDYATQIKPLLRGRCYACHGALKQEGGLRLDTAELLRRGSSSGVVIQTSDVGSSLILQRVAPQDISDRMPPEHEGEPLTAAQVDLLKRWIELGAPGPAEEQPEADPSKHWSFQTIARPDVPTLESNWVRNPIDAFLQHRHQSSGIKPQPEASRIVLLRRLYMDLIGIPPSLEEMAAFEADTSLDYYEKTVARLLNDQRHGERWARHWMDIWRYSDWWGLGDQLRNSQKHIWHWRDWIIESLNEDKPYDEMVRLMLAADELHPTDLDKLRATGFLARNYVLFNRPQWMEETVEHVSKGLLGLTMNCARCHSHKYDPLEQADYYKLRSFFEPYHARLDIVPGQADLNIDGIPRAFDALLEEPTYLYIRGDERTPDKSTTITPGVPKILAFDDLKIQPVDLPPEAWQPERRDWVPDAHIAAANKRVAEAQADVNRLDEKVKSAIATEEKIKNDAESSKQLSSKDTSKGGSIIADTFETVDEKKWKVLTGQWVHQSGGLEQKLDGPTTSSIRLLSEVPRDFDATIRFTTLGGSQWRSVGLAWDAVAADGQSNASEKESEQNVYVSAYSGGSKIQASYRKAKDWSFPGDAARALPILLNQQYTLQVQVRNTLVNARLNGEPLIAWESPVARRDGAFEVFTFDALAVIHEVAVKELDEKVELLKPESLSKGPKTLASAQSELADAKAQLTLAQTKLEIQNAELESFRQRAEALRAQWSAESDPKDEPSPLVQEKRVAAIRAERKWEAAKSKLVLVTAEQELNRAANDKKQEAEKKVADARDALVKANERVEAEIATTDKFAGLTGAAWTPTRFFDSTKDDPQLNFPPTSTGRRTALANWITDRRNPLTARVAVNHIWTRHMGQPLVPTMFDFGRNGTSPTHPELLDWLASELIDSGWSMKHLHSLIVNSAAYRMSSSVAGADGALAADPENKLWWRRVATRLESQLVRDSLLSLAGKLDTTYGGPSVPIDQQQNSKRRSLYFFHSNNHRDLFLTTFDEAMVRDCYRREQSIVPQQALALSNSQLSFEAAEQIARLLAEQSPEDHAFARNAFRLLTGINPSADEIGASTKAMESWRALPNSTTSAAQANLVWALINHNDFVTLR
jgi:Protein of unknown function (DUF1553)/Protein of unknown function (DUF1549)/Planctomycete cytochrome C